MAQVSDSESDFDLKRNLLFFAFGGAYLVCVSGSLVLRIPVRLVFSFIWAICFSTEQSKK